jgi:hypothetical protein
MRRVTVPGRETIGSCEAWTMTICMGPLGHEQQLSRDLATRGCDHAKHGLHVGWSGGATSSAARSTIHGKSDLPIAHELATGCEVCNIRAG